MTTYERKILDTVADLEPNAYGNAIRHRAGGSYGGVYAALDRLDRDGLVRAEQGEPLPERGNRPRRYFFITEEGHKARQPKPRTRAALKAVTA